MTVVKGLEEAKQVFKKHCTPRYCELDKLEAYVEGRQYEGRPNFFSDQVPLMDRAPYIIEPVVESAIESYQDLIFGEGRFPQVTSRPDEKDRAFDKQFGLNADESATLDHIIRAIYKQANVPQVSREALAQGQGSRTAVGICVIRDNQLGVDLVPSKACTGIFHPEIPGELLALEISYPYIEEYWDADEKCTKARCRLYRRVIDDQEDVTYHPLIAKVDGERPEAGDWIPNPALTKRHGFGFCPVIWYAYRRLSSKRNDHDGIAIHERELDEIDAFNLALSQRDRASLYCGDPMIIETGVSEDESPAPTGQPPLRVEDGYVSKASVSVATRKRGAGVHWTYASPKAKVAYLTLPGESLKPLEDEIDRLRNLIAEAMSWVRPLEATSADGTINISRLSSKTLSLLFKRQTSQCDTIRPDAWNGWLYPLTSMLLRIVWVCVSDPERPKLRLGGLDKAKSLLARFDADVKGGGKRWVRPILTPIWGAYFEPDEADRLALSTLYKQDFETGFITLRKVLELRKNEFGIDNIDAFMEELQKEVEQRKQEESDRLIEEATAVHKAAAAAKPKPASKSGGK